MVAVALSPVRRKAGYFYVWMAAVCALIAFGAFAPTYWLQLPAGTFVGSPLLHLHGALFFAWVLFLLSQTALAANGQLDHHRAWGLVGISLATAMVFILSTALAAGYGDSALAFFIVPVSAIGLLAGFIVAALANIRRPQAHKRFMMLATISLLQAATARVFFVLATGGGAGPTTGTGAPTARIQYHSPELDPRTHDRRGHGLRLAHPRPATSRMADRRGRDDHGDHAARAAQRYAGLAGFRRRHGAYS
jgi:hypothetical protein